MKFKRHVKSTTFCGEKRVSLRQQVRLLTIALIKCGKENMAFEQQVHGLKLDIKRLKEAGGNDTGTEQARSPKGSAGSHSELQPEGEARRGAGEASVD